MGVEYLNMKSKLYFLIDYDAILAPDVATLSILNSEGMLVANVMNQSIDQNMIKKLMYWLPEPTQVSCIAITLSVYKNFFDRLSSFVKKQDKSYVLTLRSKYVNLFSDISDTYCQLEFGRSLRELKGAKWILAANGIVRSSILEKSILAKKLKIAKELDGIVVEEEMVVSYLKTRFDRFEIHHRYNQGTVEYSVLVHYENKSECYVENTMKQLLYKIQSKNVD